MVDVEAEKKLVEEVIQGLVQADLSKNLDRIMEFFSEEIIYQFQGRPSLNGKDEVRQLLDGAFDNMEDLKAGPERTIVSESGDLAYSAGWIKRKDAGMEGYMERKFLIVLRKTDDAWKIIAQSVSANI